MQPNTGTPTTADHHYNHADPGTGAGAQAITRPPCAHGMRAYTLACVEHLDATAARYRAEQAEYRALARAHQVDPFLYQAFSRELAATATLRADSAGALALATQARADDLRKDLPAISGEPPAAVVVVTIQRDRIQLEARLLMGHAQHARQTWYRAGAHSWKTMDAAWVAHEDRIGVELMEFVDGIDLPQRVADMLPRPATAAGAAAAAQAAAEVAVPATVRSPPAAAAMALAAPCSGTGMASIDVLAFALFMFGLGALVSPGLAYAWQQLAAGRGRVIAPRGVMNMRIRAPRGPQAVRRGGALQTNGGAA